MLQKLLAESETAFYVFDSGELINRVNYLKSLLPEYVKICYAVKANTFIIKELDSIADRFEVCSPGEAEICSRMSVAPEKTVISGVYKTPSFIRRLIREKQERIYTVESLSQLELLKNAAAECNVKISVLLRLTNASQFGINKDEICEIIKNRESFYMLDILGIQFFSGTQKTSLKKIKREIEKLDLLLSELKENYGYTAKELEYGPGFACMYFDGDEYDEEAFITGFAEILDSMVFKTKITLELGRSIAASCGKYYTHIVDIKQNKGQNYIITDGGMHHLVYFGQHMAMSRPVLSVVGKEHEKTEQTYNICGSLCSMNDLLAKQVELPKIQTGDIICFENTGAYCMTEGISLFLSREIPAIYIKKPNGEIKCVRKSFETLELNEPTETEISY